jgi:hypothetical protein
MRTALRRPLCLCLFAALRLGGLPASAQEPNPWEIPDPGTYQGSMELQRREAEQQQQAQQQWSQPAEAPQWGGGTSGAPGGGGASGPSVPSVRETWEARPPLSPFANRLIGRWNSVGQVDGAPDLGIDPVLGGDLVNAFFGGMQAALCDNLLSTGLIEFRPHSVVAIGADGSERVLYHLAYRGEGARVVVLPEGSASFDHLILDVDDSGRAKAEEGCVLVRPGSAGEAAVHASTPGAPATGAGPTAPGGVATLDVTMAAPSAAGREVRVLRDPADVALIQAGVGGWNGIGTPMHRFLAACQQHTANCQAGWRAIDATTASLLKTDAAGRAQTAALPAGRYYVFSLGSDAQVWQQPIDLHAGSNAIALDAKNAYTAE